MNSLAMLNIERSWVALLNFAFLSISCFHHATEFCAQLQLYVWDESEYIPLLVRNKAAECLFGNTKAERVHSSYKKQKGEQNAIPKAKLANSHSCADNKLEPDDNHENPNYYMIWIILLKLLVQQGKNSPLKFEITVNANLERENGRFEMVNVLMPFFKTNGYPLGT